MCLESFNMHRIISNTSAVALLVLLYGSQGGLQSREYLPHPDVFKSREKGKMEKHPKNPHPHIGSPKKPSALLRIRYIYPSERERKQPLLSPLSLSKQTPPFLSLNQTKENPLRPLFETFHFLLSLEWRQSVSWWTTFSTSRWTCVGRW